MTKSEENPILLEVKQLKKHFPITGGLFGTVQSYVKALDGVSFQIEKGETLGVVGESGCGKSTLGRVALRLLNPTSGEVFFKQKNIFRLSPQEMRNLRKDMQLIFQDPYESLNPRMKVEDIIGEPLRIHGYGTKNLRKKKVQELLEVVGLNTYHCDKYPHEFSGGQRQRICIARALALSPTFIICDEPVSALDVSIQGQIINLLNELQRNFNYTYMFISHDLSVVRHISDRVAVMYLGKIVEIGPAEQLFSNPQHPYTKALISAVPLPNPEFKQQKIYLQGDVPNPINVSKGCRFHTRCPVKTSLCQVQEPELLEVGQGQQVACHLRSGSKEALA